MIQTPGIGYPPDSSVNLWRKIANNLYEIAVGYGYSDFLQPNALDNETSSMRKAVLYSAYIAEHLP